MGEGGGHRPILTSVPEEGHGPSPRVSAVIPTFNRAHFLANAIETVLAQTCSDLEVLVVDDGSTDGTAEVVADYTPSVRYLRQRHLGLCAARNTGILHSRGEFVAFLDDDDEWLPRKLDLQLQAFREHPSAAVVGGGCIYVDEYLEPLGEPVRGPGFVRYEDFAVGASLPGSGSNTLIRRSVFAEVGLFDTKLVRADDRDMWLRISERYPVYAVAEPTARIRVHSSPRHYDFATARACELEVNRRVDGPVLRWKADAHTYFLFFQRKLERGETGRALWYLIRSFLCFPLRISNRVHRAQRSAELLLPRWLYRLARSVYRRLRPD